MLETTTTIDSIATELIESILSCLPLCTIRNRALFVSRRWNACSEVILARSIRKCAELLHQEEEGHSKRDPHAWLLGNFDRQTGAQNSGVIAFELRLESLDTASKSGLFEYRHNMKALFGLWIEYVGYVRVTKPHLWSYFRFPRDHQVFLEFWFNPKLNVENSSPVKFIRGELPATKEPVKTIPGVHRLQLCDPTGHAGWITYCILSDDNAVFQDDPLSQSMYDTGYLGEGSYVSGYILNVLIDPQILFIKPI